MKKKISIRTMVLVAALMLSVIASAQVAVDTITALELNEVVIQAPKVIRKADMDVLYPSGSAVENSKNGMQLLNNLVIPTLTVNDVMGSISASGQVVQVRINGREATVNRYVHFYQSQ